MPEPDTDKFRQSPDLRTGIENPNKNEAGVPILPYIRTTDDEAYQFRTPNTAYKNPGEFELPDGLETDGSQPRKWGDIIKEEEKEEARGLPVPKG